MGSKQRRSVRRAVALECALESELWDEAVHLPASNLSSNGIWIETPIGIDLGEELIVSFTPPGVREKVWASAKVVRGTEHRPGVGLEFTYCSDSHRRLLEDALYGQPPRLPHAREPPPLPVREEDAVRPLTSIAIVGEPLPEITHGPAPSDAIVATVITPEQAPIADLGRATMQVMDEELRIEETRANVTWQVLDDEVREA
jgi:hypothetical protein